MMEIRNISKIEIKAIKIKNNDFNLHVIKLLNKSDDNLIN
jgi:hypothetical protein